MQVPSTSTPAPIDRGEDPDVPRAAPAALRAFRRVEPDPFVTFPGDHFPRSELVRAGIPALDHCPLVPAAGGPPSRSAVSYPS